MKVRFEKQKYIVPFLAKLKIEFLKFRLLVKRQKLRIKTFFPKEGIILYFIISVFWTVFAVATYFWGQSIKGSIDNPYTFTEVLWDLKNSYFTSVVLAFAVNSLNRITKHMSQIRAQHYLYTDSMRVFDYIFFQYIDDEILHYMPLYCDKTLEDTILYIYRNGPFHIDEKEQLLRFDDVYRKLDEIEKSCKKEQIIGVDAEELIGRITQARKALSIAVTDETYMQNETLENIAHKLYEVIDIIRQPWREDIEIKIEILNILDMYNGDRIREDFYYGMLLYGYNLQ